jgi:GNAT superfamily N-acetyltransferase
MGTVVIRDASFEDAQPMAELITSLGYPTSVDQMKDRLKGILSDPIYRTFCATVDGQVVGMSAANLGRYYERDGWYGRLVALGVNEGSHGLGVGRALLQRIEEWVRERGGTEITLNSSHFRTEAHAFYEHHGYANTGARFTKRFEG